MLVMSRREGESFLLHNSITGERIATVKVVDIRGDKVRIGFEADRHFHIDRQEVHIAKQAAAEKVQVVA